jgi:predicted transporter
MQDFPYDAGLRWGARMGAFGAALGIASYLIGALLIPWKPTQASAEAVLLTVFVRSLFVLVALGVTLGLAYYSGLRIGRERHGQHQSAVPPAVATISDDRWAAVLAGAIVMLLYWFVTSLYVYAFPPFGQRDASIQGLGGRFLLGLLFICLGAGLGGLGARTAATRRLVERVIIVPPPAPAAPAALADEPHIAATPPAPSALDNA